MDHLTFGFDELGKTFIVFYLKYEIPSFHRPRFHVPIFYAYPEYQTSSILFFSSGPLSNFSTSFRRRVLRFFFFKLLHSIYLSQASRGD